MPVRGLRRGATIQGNATPTHAPIYIDSDDNIAKMIPAGSGSTEVQLIDASSTQTLSGKTLTNPAITGPTPVAFTTGTTLALTQALHANRIVHVTDVAAAYTLPASTGGGDKYTIHLGATQTGAGSIKVANATDVMQGTAVLFADAGDTVVGFNTASTSDTVDLLGTANSTGGMIGAIYEFIDVAAGFWAVRIVSDAGGTEATPFSATV